MSSIWHCGPVVDMSNKPSIGSYSSSMSCTLGRDDAIVFVGDDSSVSATSGTMKLLALRPEDVYEGGVCFTGGTKCPIGLL